MRRKTPDGKIIALDVAGVIAAKKSPAGIGSPAGQGIGKRSRHDNRLVCYIREPWQVSRQQQRPRPGAVAPMPRSQPRFFA
jgi:hypothetical protein